jgi:hypothetical protein
MTETNACAECSKPTSRNGLAVASDIARLAAEPRPIASLENRAITDPAK